MAFLSSSPKATGLTPGLTLNFGAIDTARPHHRLVKNPLTICVGIGTESVPERTRLNIKSSTQYDNLCAFDTYGL
jgi:hypothetical protein